MSYIIVADSEEEAEAKLLRSFPQSKGIQVRELRQRSQSSENGASRRSIRRNHGDSPTTMMPQHYHHEDNGATRDIVVGGIFFLGGSGVTIATYLLASGGGTYVIAWGAIIFGLFQMVRGFASLKG